MWNSLPSEQKEISTYNDFYIGASTIKSRILISTFLLHKLCCSAIVVMCVHVFLLLQQGRRALLIVERFR